MQNKINNALFKIFSQIIDYEIIISGTELPINTKKGALLLTLLNARPLTTSAKDFNHLIKIIENENDDVFIESKSLYTSSYQLDLYKENPRNLGYIEVNQKAYELQEYLKSYDVAETLKEANAEILPNFSNIRFLTDYNENKKLVNRASFDFEIIFTQINLEKIDKFDKININLNTI